MHTYIYIINIYIYISYYITSLSPHLSSYSFTVRAGFHSKQLLHCTISCQRQKPFGLGKAMGKPLGKPLGKPVILQGADGHVIFEIDISHRDLRLISIVPLGEVQGENHVLGPNLKSGARDLLRLRTHPLT